TMQPFYADGGFHFQYRTPRMEGVGKSSAVDSRIVELSSLPFTQVQAFDQQHFGYDRSIFLQRWIVPRNGLGLGYWYDGQLTGIGVLRACLSGFKIGPLFAQDEAVADALFDAFSSHAAGQPLFLDVPESNPRAMALAQRKG